MGLRRVQRRGWRPSTPGPHRLQWGPGPNWVAPDDSWLTIDVDPTRADILAEFNRGFDRLPLDDRSVLAVYGSHVFEHMSPGITPVVFAESYRVLRPGGWFRLVMPDARRSIEQYLAENEDFELFVRRRERGRRKYGIDYTLFERMREDFVSRTSQQKFLGAGALAHQNAWDFPTISADLERAGFDPERIHRVDFQKSNTDDFAFEGTFDSEANEADRSLYVEAQK